MIYLISTGSLLLFFSGLMIGCAYGYSVGKRPPPMKCPHGYDWDDCPVCNH